MRILIISEYIAPIQRIASVRWTKIAKYIKKHHPDTHITVLTTPKDFEKGVQAINREKKDSLLEKDMQYFDEYWEIPFGRMTNLYYRTKRKKINTIRQISSAEKKAASDRTVTENLKNDLLTSVHDLKSYVVSREFWRNVRKRPLDFDAVISTFDPPWPHLLAERIKKANNSIIWLADFRDPFASSFDGPWSYKRHTHFTMKHFSVANMILRVSDTYSMSTPPQVPVCVIPNGYDPEETLPPLKPQHFDIVFTGTLYGERSDIGIACEVLKQLCAEGQVDAEDVSVVYVGQEDIVAKDLAEKHNAKEFLRTTGFLPRSKARELQQTAAVLLQAGWSTEIEKCLWTGKMYEYMAAHKPILYLVSGDIPYSEPNKYIHLLDGYCYEQCRHEETCPGMKEYILKKYREWKLTGNVTVQQDLKYIEQYSYAHIAEQVFQLIQRGTDK